MKVWELEALTDAHFMEQSCHDKDLEEAGIDSVFHGTLISAGLDLETLKMAADDRRYLDCVRRRGAFGTAKPASDTRRHARVLCAQNIKLLVLPRWRSRRLVLSELSAASAMA